MRILIKSSNLEFDVRKVQVHDFFMELKRHADVDLSFERQAGAYDVCIKGTKGTKVNARITTDLHKPLIAGKAMDFVQELNASKYNLILMRYHLVNYPGYKKTFYRDNLTARVEFFPWSLDANKWLYSEDKNNDVVFLGSTGEGMYPLRAAIKQSLPLPYKTVAGNVSMELKRDRYALKKKHRGAYVGDDYIRVLQRSKVMLTDGSVYGQPVKKCFEAMATGCLLLADKPNHADEVGLIPGETFVEISKGDWREKLDYYLKHDEERLRITRNARQLFEQKHTNEIRAKALIQVLKDMCKK